MTGLLVASLSVAGGGPGPARQAAAPRLAGPMGPPPPAAAARVSDRARTAGIRLLDQAVRAARQASYQGMQVVSWTPGGGGGWLGSGSSTVTVGVLHREGQPPDGMLGLTPALIGLLGTHYVVTYCGPGSAGGRRARVVEALRADGSVAARFWLDAATALPLRRELFDSRAQLVSDDGFDRLQLTAPASKTDPASKTAPASKSAPASGARPAGRVLNATFRPWANKLQPGQLAALRTAGWPVPRLLPGDLTLFDARESGTPAHSVVDLAYSDGLSVVSVFVQRGQLPSALPGWRATDLSGNRLFVKDQGEPDLTWSAGGFVFTMVAAAPAPTVAAAVNALPHQVPSGFWTRMKRGMSRLLSWMNPFR